MKSALSPRALCVVGLVWLVGCPKPAAPVVQVTGPAPTPELLYSAAVKDAAQPTAAEISPRLVAIRPETAGLRWSEDKRRVLVTVYTNWDGYQLAFDQKAPLTLAREVWVTPSPWLQRFCQQGPREAGALAARVRQRLGLPPEDNKDRVAELWVAPEDLFRPCPDAEIDDTSCALDFPASASPEHRAWIEDLRSRSYGDPGYPWTQLGYTYDWAQDTGGPLRHEGESEFIAKRGATVTIEKVTSLETYCAR